MIASNADLPDIERLERQDFILDTEEHQQILAEKKISQQRPTKGKGTATDNHIHRGLSRSLEKEI